MLPGFTRSIIHIHTILIGIRSMNPVGVSIGGSVLADMVVITPTGIVLIMVVGITHGTLLAGVAIMAEIMDQDTGVVDMPIPAVIIMADKIIPALAAQIVSDTAEQEVCLHRSEFRKQGSGRHANIKCS